MNRKIRVIVITIMILILTFTVSTYAWLQLNSVNVLELSLDGMVYGQEIKENDLGRTIRNHKLFDVTTQDGKIFTQGLSKQEAKPGIHYIAFDLYFRVKPTTQEKTDNEVLRYIYLIDKKSPTYEDRLKAEGTYAVSKGMSWKSPVTFNNGDQLIEKGQSHRYYAQDALRIGFNNESHHFIYDISENEERGFGKPYGALDYYQKMTGEHITPPNKPQTIYQLTPTDPYRPYEAVNDDSLVATLEDGKDGYYYGKTTVNIWIEGWDADSFDAIIKDQVYIQLNSEH